MLREIDGLSNSRCVKQWANLLKIAFVLISSFLGTHFLQVGLTIVHNYTHSDNFCNARTTYMLLSSSCVTSMPQHICLTDSSPVYKYTIPLEKLDFEKYHKSIPVFCNFNWINALIYHYFINVLSNYFIWISVLMYRTISLQFRFLRLAVRSWKWTSASAHACGH